MRDEMDDWMVLVCGPCWHELVIASHGMLNKRIRERTRSDIMIKIHLPNIEKGSIRLGREDLSDYHSQPQIRRHKVYKIAKDLNVNDVIPVFLSMLTACWRELSTLKQMLYALTAWAWASSWSLSGSLGSNGVMFVDEGRENSHDARVSTPSKLRICSSTLTAPSSFYSSQRIPGDIFIVATSVSLASPSWYAS